MPTDAHPIDQDIPTEQNDDEVEDDEAGSENAETELIRRENVGRRGRPPKGAVRS